MVKNGKLLTENERAELGHLSGSRDSQGWSGSVNSRREIIYLVQKIGENSSLTVTVNSRKGGVVKKEIKLTN